MNRCDRGVPRRAATPTTTLLLAAAALGISATPAFAEDPPGNRGTVKVHEIGTSDDDRREEPHVCDFRIVGFGFPADADLLVEIVGHGGPNAGSGSFTADLGTGAVDAEGDFALDGPTLPDGMYRLTVENRTAPGGAKQKVFHVECPAAVEEEAATTTTTTTTVATTTTTLAGGETTEDEETTTTTAAPPTTTATTTAVGSTGERESAATDVLGVSEVRTPQPRSAATQVAAAGAARPQALALTGGDVLAMTAAGLGLVAGGSALRRRRA